MKSFIFTVMESDSSLARVITIGESSVGKTAILTRLMSGEYTGSDKPTVGASFIIHSEMIEGEVVQMQIWDTAGQERFRSLGPIYYRNAKAGILVFDFTSYESFERLDQWISQFIDIAGSNTVVAIVGNKIDLESDSRLSTDMVSKWAKARGYMFFATSALTGEGIDVLFRQIAVELKHRQKNARRAAVATTDINQQKKSSGCC